MMNSILELINRKFVVVYLDDIVIYSATFDERTHVWEVISLLAAKVLPKKMLDEILAYAPSTTSRNLFN